MFGNFVFGVLNDTIGVNLLRWEDIVQVQGVSGAGDGPHLSNITMIHGDQQSKIVPLD